MMLPDADNSNLGFRFLQQDDTVTISYEGTPVVVPKGVTVAAALLVAGYPAGRRSSKSASPRSVYCGIGQCFECTMIIDGVVCRQACMEPVRQGMHVARQTV